MRKNWSRLIIVSSSMAFVIVCAGLFFKGEAIMGWTAIEKTPSAAMASGGKGDVMATSGKADQLAVAKQVTLIQQMMVERYMLLTSVRSLMLPMTEDQKLGQLVLVEFVGSNYQSSGLEYMIKQQHVGGFIYQESNRNFTAPLNVIEQVRRFSEQAQRDATIPLMIATDQEGGLVNRLYRFHGYLPSAQQMRESGDPRVALNEGIKAAKWMKELGINADFAPVVDVQTVDPPVLVTRMFGSDPQTVVRYAGAYLNGLQQNGVMGCLKHFPGLGAISSDPHLGLPRVDRTKRELEQIDLAPYSMMLKRDKPAMVMATDVLMPALDPDLPAELSPKVINGVLRRELGYEGVVVTDGLYMGGISQRWSLSEASVLSILAGGDLVEGPFAVRQVANILTALKTAVGQGKISQERINQSVLRILMMKARYGIVK